MTYLFVIVLALLNLSLPANMLPVLELFASANSFLSMSVIGLYLDVDLPASDF